MNTHTTIVSVDGLEVYRANHPSLLAALAYLSRKQRFYTRSANKPDTFVRSIRRPYDNVLQVSTNYGVKLFEVCLLTSWKANRDKNILHTVYK